MQVFDSRGVIKTLKANFAEMSTTAQAVADTDLIPYSQVISGVNRTQNIAKSVLVTGGGGGVSFTNSAGLRSNISDPTGDGKAVFNTSPWFKNEATIYSDPAVAFANLALNNDNGYVLASLYDSNYSAVPALANTFFFNAGTTVTGGLRFFAAATTAPITFEIGTAGNAILRLKNADPHATVTGKVKIISGDSTSHTGLMVTNDVTDGVVKQGGFRSLHYNNAAEEDVALFTWGCTTTTNTLAIGSADSDANSLTILKLFIGASNTTIASSAVEMLRWNSVGLRIEKGVTATADAACIIDFVSTTQGVGLPVMATSQKNSVSAREGNVVYDSTLHKISVRAASAWETVTST